jgi:hypothetical protein
MAVPEPSSVAYTIRLSLMVYFPAVWMMQARRQRHRAGSGGSSAAGSGS